MSNSDSVCIFVSSSDRTRDVFDQVFVHFGHNWPDCPSTCFVGLTTPPRTPVIGGFTVITADSESGWRQELTEQLSKLPVAFDRVLLLLDDFLLLEKVDTPGFEALVGQAREHDMAYLKMKPLDRSWIGNFLSGLSAPTEAVEELQPDQPYYSSLQAALWKKDHLLWCLAQPGSIWQFEHLVPQGHWAVRKAALPYRHVVEKGRWMADTPALFRSIGQAFDPGTRASWPWSAGLRWQIDRLKFGLIGYGGMKAKRWLRGKIAKG
jgi:hypothetical protein